MRRLLNTLYVMDQGAYLRKRQDAISVCTDDGRAISVPFHVLESVVLFGHPGCSLPLLEEIAGRGIGITLLNESGAFRARVEGPVTGSVLLRRAQYRCEEDQQKRLRLAGRFVVAKIANCRNLLMHYRRDYPETKDELGRVAEQLAECRSQVPTSSTLYELRGIEGLAARAYFQAFPVLLRKPEVAATFSGRTRRPPRDPVNAALSFLYTILSRDIATACESVGLDPQLGYLHSCRPGRQSLALDLIEEMRAPLVDRFVLTLFNRGQLGSDDFVADGCGAMSFRPDVIKRILSLWQQRKQEEVKHPFLGEKVPLGLIPFVQAQLLARHLRGDLDDYPAIVWR